MLLVFFFREEQRKVFKLLLNFSALNMDFPFACLPCWPRYKFHHLCSLYSKNLLAFENIVYATETIASKIFMCCRSVLHIFIMSFWYFYTIGILVHSGLLMFNLVLCEIGRAQCNILKIDELFTYTLILCLCLSIS